MSDESPYNWIDDPEPVEPDNEAIERLHRVFMQTEDGKLILEEWLKATVFPTRTEDKSAYRCGFLDGQAHLPRMIIGAIERVENGGI